MAKMKRLWKIIKTKSNWVSIITFVLAFIVFCISFFTTKFSYQIITLMFTLIAAENFLKHIFFMEDIKNKLNDLEKQDSKGIKTIEDINNKLNDLKRQDPVGIKIKKTDDFVEDTKKFLLESQKEIIMIGGSMSRFTGAINPIIRHSQKNNVKVRILALNVLNNEIRERYAEMINYKNAPINLDHLIDLKNKENIEVRTYEFLPTAYYFAIDLNTQNGKIWASHIFYGVSQECDYPHVIVDGSDEYWYETYRNHIESLWEKGVPWL